jgi:hypothetical protein
MIASKQSQDGTNVKFAQFNLRCMGPFKNRALSDRSAVLAKSVKICKEM